MIKIIILLLLITFTSIQGKRCRVIAVSGGGDKGAYEAGAIKGLIDGLPSPEGKTILLTSYFFLNNLKFLYIFDLFIYT